MAALLSKNDILGILPTILIRIDRRCAYAEYLATEEIVNRNNNHGQEKMGGCRVSLNVGTNKFHHKTAPYPVLEP